MNHVKELILPWLHCQTKLKETLRWSKYISLGDDKSSKCNGIRKQNVADHTLSKLFAFSMLLPMLEKVFDKNVDFNLLWSCIVSHDFGEGLRGQKYDILAGDKKDNDDVDEYTLVMELLDKSDLPNGVIRNGFEKAFLLQFILTSHKSFPARVQVIMRRMRHNRIVWNTAVLFQIVEKWEYLFYAYEHEEKHPTIFRDVYDRNIPIISQWIQKYPKKYHQSLKEIFID